MKLRRTLPLLVVVSVAVAACSSGDDDADAPTDSSPAAEPAGEPEPTPDETAPPTTGAPETTAAPESTVPVTTTPVTTAPATTEPPPAPFELAGPGPFTVGVSTITVGEGSERPLTVDVWFPVADATGLDPHQYTLLPGTYYESPAAVSATADLIAADGPFPLVVYSHGSGGLRYVHSAYTEALASYGYVVAAPDHTGNTTLDQIAGTSTSGEETAFNRPADVARVIDAFTATGDDAAGPASAWSPHVDGERVAVTGHSFGGYTSVAMVAGAASTLGDVAPDERVDAIIPIAPALSELTLPDELLAAIDVPVLVIAGTSDESTPIDPNVTRLWDLVTGSPAYRVDLVDGEHQTFTDLCAYLDFLPMLDAVPAFVTDTIDERVGDACSPTAIDAERATDLTAGYAIEFLDQVFRGGDPIVATHPDDVIFQQR